MKSSVRTAECDHWRRANGSPGACVCHAAERSDVNQRNFNLREMLAEGTPTRGSTPQGVSRREGAHQSTHQRSCGSGCRW